MPTLQQITPDNALIYKAIRLQALQDSPTAFGSTYAVESQRSDADWIHRVTLWNQDRSRGYLAMEAHTPCGLAAAFINDHDPLTAHLISMWVAPTHRRTGVGRSIIDALYAWARSHSAQTLLLTVTSTNQPAIDFYKKNHFSLTGQTEPYPNDPTLLEYQMSRPILA